MDHHIHAPLFSEVHSCLEREWEGAAICIPDDGKTAAARRAWEKTQSPSAAIDFINALRFQLRYTDCLPILEEQLKDYRDGYAVRRQLGTVYYKCLQFKRSADQLKSCLHDTDDPLNVLYLLGVVSYYRGDYEQAEAYLNRCLPLCPDGEMTVAALYWLALCSLRLKRAQKTPPFKGGVDCGHHTGYDAFLKLAAGTVSEREAVALGEADTPLNRTCLYYGMSVLFEADQKKRTLYLEKTLFYRDYFGGFAYIAAYTDRKRLN